MILILQPVLEIDMDDVQRLQIVLKSKFETAEPVTNWPQQQQWAQ